MLSSFFMGVIVFGSLAMVLVYGYLYYSYRQRYIGIWVLSWFIYFVRQTCFDPLLFSSYDNVYLRIAYQFMTIASGVLLVAGTYEFIKKKLNRGWLYLAVIATILSDSLVISNLSFICAAIPTAVYFGTINIVAGIHLWRNKVFEGPSKYVTSLAFIFLGIHDLDFPLFRPETSFITIGYLLDASLRGFIAVGIFLVYFQKTRDELSERDHQFQLFAENANEYIFRYNLFPTPAYIYISPGVKKITGFEPRDFYLDHQLATNIIHPDDHMAISHGVTNGPPISESLVYRIIRKDGTFRWIEMHSMGVTDQNGKTIAIEGHVKDVTAQKEISRLDRLNILGQMAASVAHEIRNPLTTIRGFLQLLSSKQEFLIYKNQFSLMLEELDRTNSIITDYLSLSKEHRVDFQSMNLNSVIQALTPLIQADANNADIVIKKDLGSIVPIAIDEKQIRQLILNLVRNAMDAMSSGGILTLKTFMDNDDIVLSVTDTGPGIPLNVLTKIGTPFFTTKEHGSGLGLAVCYSIAERHNAKIEIDTNSHGTIFIVRFSPHIVH